jgi:hypothetical protein
MSQSDFQVLFCIRRSKDIIETRNKVTNFMLLIITYTVQTVQYQAIIV